MSFLRFTKRRVLVIGILIVLYGLGYFGVRSHQILIHGVAFETTDSGRRYYHCVRVADFGPSLAFLRRDSTDYRPVFANISYWIFTPLRLAESCCWHFIPRHYGI